MEYLEWHSNQKAHLFLPYPNPSLKDKYVMAGNDPDAWEKKWRIVKEQHDQVIKALNENDYNKRIEELEKYRQIHPIRGERSYHVNMGVAKRRLEDNRNAVIHLLLAIGIANYKADWKDHETYKIKFGFPYYHLFPAYRDLRMEDQAKIIESKFEAWKKL